MRSFCLGDFREDESEVEIAISVSSEDEMYEMDEMELEAE